MKTSDITKHKRLPSFIKSHKIFSKFEQVKKIFPLIGLDNCFDKASSYESITSNAAALRSHLIKIFNPNSSSGNYFNDRVRARNIHALLTGTKASDFIKDGKIVPVPEKLKKQITDINQQYRLCRFSPLHKIYSWYKNTKAFVPEQKLSSKYKIYFSSADEKGAWDIATMSMRGFGSCQSWTGSYKRNLVGSIIDPFLGIIYMTDGVSSGKGHRMLKRALVRYVVSRKTGKPALLLERVYPNDRYVRNGDSRTVGLFKAFLKEKTKNKLPIVTSATGYSIPNSKIVKAMSSCGSYVDASDFCRSYRDSGIGYSRSTKVNFPKIKSF